VGPSIWQPNHRENNQIAISKEGGMRRKRIVNKCRMRKEVLQEEGKSPKYLSSS
ncbi:Ceruloplasmin, partial [Manis pentadactyla]